MEFIHVPSLKVDSRNFIKRRLFRKRNRQKLRIRNVNVLNNVARHEARALRKLSNGCCIHLQKDFKEKQ